MLCRKQLQKTTRQGLFLVVVFSFIRESCFSALLKFFPALKLVRGPAVFCIFLSGIFLQQILDAFFRLGKRLFVPPWKIKDAFLTFKFKIALGTKMICQLQKRVVLCAVTSFIFNYIF